MCDILYFAEKPGAPYEAHYLRPFLERTGGRLMLDDPDTERSMSEVFAGRPDIVVEAGTKADLGSVDETVTVYTNFYPRSASRFNVFFQHGVADKKGMARVHTFKDQRSLVYRASMMLPLDGRLNPLSNRAMAPFRWLRRLTPDRFDLILVPGRALYDLFDGIGALRKGNHEIIGFPRLDPVIRGEIDREEVLRGLDLDPDRKTVMYAPTWHGKHAFDMNSMSSMAAHIVDAVGELTNLIVRPHPRTSLLNEAPEAMTLLRERHSDTTNIRLVEDPAADTVRLMVAADLMISDYSSVGIEFLTLDRPVVFIDHLGEVHADPSLTEIYVREAGVSVSDGRELGRTIRHGLECPAEGSATRKRLARHIFGPMDGRASERGSAAITALLDR